MRRDVSAETFIAPSFSSTTACPSPLRWTPYVESPLRRFRSPAGRRVYMQDYLVAVTGGPAIEVRAQRALGQEAERIRTTLGRRHLVGDPVARRALRGFLEQPVGGCLERALDDRTDLGRQPASQAPPSHRHRRASSPTDADGAVRLLRRLDLIHPPPGADEALYLRRRAGECEIDEPRVVPGCRDPRERPHFGVRQLAALHRRADVRKRRQRAGDTHLLAGGTRDRCRSASAASGRRRDTHCSSRRRHRTRGA